MVSKLKNFFVQTNINERERGSRVKGKVFPRKNMLIKSLVLILVNDSILGNKNERAALALNAKEESVKKKNRYKEKFNVSKLSEQFV